MTKVPQPLHPGSRKLARNRYHAWVGNRIAEDRAAMAAEGRFVSIDHAKAWADAEHPNAEVVLITGLSAATGWHRETLVARRDDGKWLEREREGGARA